MWNKTMTNTQSSKYLLQSLSDPRAGLLLIKFSLGINRINVVEGTAKELAKAWGISERNFIYGVKELKRLDIVRKYTKREYMLNPDVTYNGGDKQLYLIKHLWDTQTTRGLRDAAN